MPAHSEIHHGRHDVARVHSLIHEGPGLPRPEPGRRLVLGFHGLLAQRIASEPAPGEETPGKDQQREREPALIQEEPAELLYLRREADVPRRPSRHHGQPLPNPQRPSGSENEKILRPIQGEISSRGAKRTREGQRADGLHGNALRQPHHRLGLADRRRPFVPRDVPVELIVVVKRQEPPAHPVENGHRPRDVLGPRHPGFDLHVSARVGDLSPQRTAVTVQDLDAIHPEVVTEALPLVADRDGAVDSLVTSPEGEGDGLPHEQAGVRIHLEGGFERLDRIGAGLGLRGRDQEEKEEDGGREPAHAGPARCRRTHAELAAPPGDPARRIPAS